MLCALYNSEKICRDVEKMRKMDRATTDERGAENPLRMPFFNTFITAKEKNANKH